MIQNNTRKLLLLALLIAAGIALEIAGVFDARNMLALARDHVDQRWLVVLLILLQVILFTFALAGSFLLWVVAPLYPPAMAAFILAAGATLGGITAYLFSRRLTDEWVHKIEKSHTYSLLRQHDNFFTLFALRLFPAFPHSLVNYSSGMLRVRLSHFILSAIAGIYIKSYIYSRVIYNAADAASLQDLMDFSIFGPLLLLSGIIFAGVFVKYKLTDKSDREDTRS